MKIVNGYPTGALSRDEYIADYGKAIQKGKAINKWGKQYPERDKGKKVIGKINGFKIYKDADDSLFYYYAGNRINANSIEEIERRFNSKFIDRNNEPEWVVSESLVTPKIREEVRMKIFESSDNSYETNFRRLEYIKDVVNAADKAVESAEGDIPPSLTRAISRIYTAASSAESVLKYINENRKSSDKNITVESSQYDDFSDDELASIYGGDTSQSQKDLARSELLSSMNALKIKVKSGINWDGFDVTVVDDRNHTVYDHSYSYGWDVSWDKGFASKDKPYVSDVIKSLCDKYNIPKENIFVYAGTNMFAGKPVKADAVERFKTRYVDPIKLENVVKENWQDDWVEPTIDPNPIDNVNGLDIYKGTDQYGEEAYYLFLEDDEYPEPGYEEWQTETLELAREWASSYEPVDFVEEDLLVRGSDRNIIRESYSKGIPREILDMIKDSKRVRNAFIEIGLDPSKMIIDKVDKFHKNNPNYLPVEVYEYNLEDRYSDHSTYGGVGIKIGGYKDIYDSMPGAYVKKTKTIGIYEIDITKNIENNAILGDKIELRATNKNDPKNQYLDRFSYRDPTVDKSGYFTVGKFKSKYGKDELTRRHDIMKGESVEADDFDDEIEPNAYKYIFKALDKGYWDDFEWLDVKYYDGKPCRVTGTSVVGPDFESSYHDIEFKDGTKFSAISGIHLQPLNKVNTDRKVEGATRKFVKKGSIIHNAGETLEVLDQNSDDTLLVGLDNGGDRKDRYIIAWGLQPDGSWNQGHYYTDEKTARNHFDKRAKKQESASIF